MLALGFVLLVANAGLFLFWPFRNQLGAGVNSADAPYEVQADGSPYFKRASLLRNAAHLEWLFDEVIRQEHLLMIGTSESIVRWNIGAQLNAMNPAAPGVVVVAQAGLSPIHQCLIYARSKALGMQPPPLMLIVNLVYFTASHDGINEGWLGTAIPTATFLRFNHHQVHDFLTPEVLGEYRRHFAHRLPLEPVWAQQYLANLVFLNWHQRPREWITVDGPGPRRYSWNGVVPDYDRDRGVPVGRVPVDQVAGGRRWQVNDVEDSANLMGLICSLELLAGRHAAPVLVVVLPTNRVFYEYSGLDMEVYELQYARIRRRIASAVAAGENLYLTDLYEMPLDMGFADRMHADAYGNFQIAEVLISQRAYGEYLAHAKAYDRGPTRQPVPDGK